MRLRILPLLALLAALPAGPLLAQDPFEIQVYEYATVPKGRWNLETHFNYTSRGTGTPEGTVAPTEGQSHLTFELTRGVTDLFEMAGYLVLAKRAGHGVGATDADHREVLKARPGWLF